MRPGTVILIGALLAAVVMASGLGGCGDGEAMPTSTSPSSALPPLTTTTSSSSTTATPPGTAGTIDELSDSIEYARSLGGISHLGETLYFVVGAMVETEEEAQALLHEAIPFFGDMQSYFIVQRSDSFEGFEPGKWVIVESYGESPSPENIEFGQRAFPDAYVTSAKVLTSDPIPVYEDRLGL